MYTLGLPLAVEPKMIPSSLMPRPQVLLFVERRNSSFEPSGLKRKKPWRNRCGSPPTVSRESL